MGKKSFRPTVTQDCTLASAPVIQSSTPASSPALEPTNDQRPPNCEMSMNSHSYCSLDGNPVLNYSLHICLVLSVIGKEMLLQVTYSKRESWTSNLSVLTLSGGECQGNGLSLWDSIRKGWGVKHVVYWVDNCSTLLKIVAFVITCASGQFQHDLSLNLLSLDIL